MKRYLVVLVALVLSGCTMGQTKSLTGDAGKLVVKVSPNRCKVLGKAKTSHVFVVVTKDCMVRGTTTVSIVVLDQERKGRVAGEHAMQAVTSILGYRPTLGVLTYGKVKGRYLILAAVTDPALALRR